MARTKHLKEIPEEEYEYAQKILTMVKEKIAREKTGVPYQEYKKVIDEFEDL